MTPSTRSSDALLDAAVALIAESGLDALTHTAVAARAGVSRATAYREFGDKDGLVSAVGRHEVGKMVAAAFAAIDPGASAGEMAYAATLFALRYLREHRAFRYIRVHEPAWLLTVAIEAGDSRLTLVGTVAAFAEALIASRADPTLALPARQAAEVVVRTVLSHALVQDSALTDEEIARTVARAITTTPEGVRRPG
ncbi:helix-turn-helix domain-containing protein [Nocardia sp. NPDC024068]|uniref:TetR/AcrR family transcriptional regulator n=1 Tax=Nocardia sp. NPDC024068 TaxID=3157197 RepID=UPI0033D521C2